MSVATAGLYYQCKVARIAASALKYNGNGDFLTTGGRVSCCRKLESTGRYTLLAAFLTTYLDPKPGTKMIRCLASVHVEVRNETRDKNGRWYPSIIIAAHELDDARVIAGTTLEPTRGLDYCSRLIVPQI